MNEQPFLMPTHCAFHNILICTTTRAGGVSKGQYQSLNVGNHVGDLSELVDENRRIVDSRLSNMVHPFHSQPLTPVTYLNQTHSNVVTDVDTVIRTPQVECDACYTDEAGKPVAVMTADCLPIIITDGRRVAAVHAGWKGLANGIIEKAVEKFEKPNSLFGYIGPFISQQNYQVDASLQQHFPLFEQAFASSSEDSKRQFSLSYVAVEQLKQLGISNIEVNSTCTYASPFLFSHRQTTHEGYSQTGRQVTIAVKLFDLD